MSEQEPLAPVQIPPRALLRRTNVRSGAATKGFEPWSPDELQDRLDNLIADDEAFQDEYGVPDPEAVSTADLPVDDQDALQERWEDRSGWRTVRRDIKLLRRAVERAHGL